MTAQDILLVQAIFDVSYQASEMTQQLSMVRNWVNSCMISTSPLSMDSYNAIAAVWQDLTGAVRSWQQLLESLQAASSDKQQTLF